VSTAPGIGGDANLFAFAFTNITVTLIGANSFDGAAICVGPAATWLRVE
jgi:hypothetical protein